MPNSDISIVPLSDQSLLVSWPNGLDAATHAQVMRLCHALEQSPFPGFIEAVPAYCSLTVFYHTVLIRKSTGQPAYGQVKQYIEQLLDQARDASIIETGAPLIRIPVAYGGKDLNDLAARRGLDVSSVVDLHTQTEYRVYLIGFLPGFPYMGQVDERIAQPRKPAPVPVMPGSVGIAGVQTGIYPVASPGGWYILGSTPLTVFDPARNPACLLRVGDRVQFYAI